VEGRQIALEIGRSGSGARYEWPSDGSGYVWWVKGKAATLYWRDGDAGSETAIYSDCMTGD
jgi:membrane-bound inhibitor of C-type lysozyme